MASPLFVVFVNLWHFDTVPIHRGPQVCTELGALGLTKYTMQTSFGLERLPWCLNQWEFNPVLMCAGLAMTAKSKQWKERKNDPVARRS